MLIKHFREKSCWLKGRKLFYPNSYVLIDDQAENETKVTELLA
jgi:hypothetical protein